MNCIHYLIKQLNIREYYIINRYGAYLLIGPSRKYVFISYTLENLDEFCEVYIDESKFKDYINQIRSGSHIPFFGIKNDLFEAD